MNPACNNNVVEQLFQAVRSFGFDDAADTWALDYASDVASPAIRIAFIGEFNHGKSSIINALCGQDLLPGGVTPTTQVDTDVVFDERDNAVTAWSGSTIVAQWALDIWKKKAVRLTADAMQKNAITRIRVSLRQPSPIPMCSFIDTPGLNESSLLRESGIEQTLARADIVVFTLDANQPVTRTEMNFLAHLASKLEPDKRLLVINKCDPLDDDDWLQICAHVENSTAPLLGDDLFYMVSARRPEIGDWFDFCAELSSRAKAARETVREDASRRVEAALRPVVTGMRWIADFIDAMPTENRARLARHYKASPYSLPPKQLAEHIAAVENRMAQLQTETQNRLTRFEQDFLRAIGRELDKASIDDIASYVEDFIDDAYAQFAAQEIESHTDAIQKICLETCQRLSGTDDGFNFGDLSAAMRESIFDSVMHNVRNSSPTGAFDATRLRIAGLLFKPLFVGRIERPVRDTLCSMAEKAIALRGASYRIAFDDDLSRFCTALVGIVRELGPAWQRHILQVVRSKNTSQTKHDFSP